MWPFQRQPTNTQPQVPGPVPGQGMRIPSRGQLARNSIVAPFPRQDPFQGPPRDIDLILQERSGTPLNAYLSELLPTTGGIPHFKHKHRMRNTLVRDYPKSPWHPDRRAPFLAPDAYTSLRNLTPAFAPPQAQRTAGGLQVSLYNQTVSNVNINLAEMYAKSAAPSSANHSGMVRR